MTMDQLNHGSKRKKNLVIGSHKTMHTIPKSTNVKKYQARQPSVASQMCCKNPYR